MTNSIPTQSRPILLSAQYQLNKSQLYQTNTTTTHPNSFPSTGYPYIMIPHPSNSELTLGRVYTRDINLSLLYVQHYVLVTDPIDGHKLKNTNCNRATKGDSKYSPTHTASAIRQCPGCFKNDDDVRPHANRMARRNNRCNITCLFKQDTAVVTILPMKSHQIYQDIVLLQQPINDLINTNHLIPLPSPCINVDQTDHIIRTSNQLPNVDLDRLASHSIVNFRLIDRLINSPDIVSQLKKLTQALAEHSILSFYTDGSLVRTSSNVDTMGLGWVNEFDESI